MANDDCDERLADAPAPMMEPFPPGPFMLTFTPLLTHRLTAASLIVASLLGCQNLAAQEPSRDRLQARFDKTVRPFLKEHCLDCHGEDVQEAKLDLSAFESLETVSAAHQTWREVRARIAAVEMPPPDADSQPSLDSRQGIVRWIDDARRYEAVRNAGDPGPVLTRRLNGAEYNYAVRDLTGVDIRPTKTFPVDPANEAGFDNSGESLQMSPALLKKYLTAAREVADHLVLKPRGIAFAAHPVATDTDRDKYCVKRIVQFYERQPTDLADYFFVAWRSRRQANDKQPLAELAAAAQVSPRYLELVATLLSDEKQEAGPIAALRSMWSALPDDETQVTEARRGCSRMRDFVSGVRQRLSPTHPNLYISESHKGSQPFVLWKNRQYAAHRRKYNAKALLDAAPDNASRIDLALVEPGDKEERRRFVAALDRFCEVFPDAFYVSERGRDYLDVPREKQEKGRLLSAGFHSMMGYFRDDRPLYDLILDNAQREELDQLWRELDFVAAAPIRQYSGFLWFERTDSRYMRDPVFDFARAENKDAATEKLIERLAEVYVDKAERVGGGETELAAIRHFFVDINKQIRWVEEARERAAPTHLAAIITFAERAFRRPLTDREQQSLLAFYRHLLEEEKLGHAEAVKDTLVSILMSPHFCYRLDLGGTGDKRAAIPDQQLASRLSFFLWSSLPDQRLLDRAAVGELRRPAVIAAEARRMLRDDRVRGLAIEFGGNWLDFRRFEEHNAVARERFPQFTDELRQAMFEEPVRFFVDVAKRDRSVLDFLFADDTFVNPALAQHYGVADSLDSKSPSDWTRIENANEFGRGGLLPMSVFLTKNSPGLRTSPVKRGYWVVRRLLGERIPPPPPGVPDLPPDEAQLGDRTLSQVLARHRENPSCAGCHNRFDSIGVAFERFGPVGERRRQNLAGKDVDTRVRFPGKNKEATGVDGDGIAGLQNYLREHRRVEYLDNICRKLLSYALGRSLIPADDLLIARMRDQLAENDHRFGSLIETIVTSPQFLQRRASD
ncbi:MAG: DUF1592 domain-containing protein [Pirellulaceae bacterium]|nr:DUF1592 domain-containing protein [Pirellulaceae bacterium]